MLQMQETQVWLGRSPGGGNGNTLQFSCLGNPMERGAWRAIDHGITKSQTYLVTEQQQQYITFLSDLTFLFV